MQSSSRQSQAPRPRRFDASRRTTTAAEPKSHGPGIRREDKNSNTINTSSPRRPTKSSSETPRTRVGVQPRAPVGQSRLGLKKHGATPSSLAKPKPKGTRASAASKLAPPPPPPPPPPLLPLDPNCNEPSLPCLCCDGRSPQDNNSMFNHNHNNNNTVSLRHQMQLQPPLPLLPKQQEAPGAKDQGQTGPPQAQAQPQPQLQAPVSPAAALEDKGGNKDGGADLDNKKNVKIEEDEDDEESSGDIDIDVDDDEDEDEDDDTLVPSCCDCPASLLDFSLTSSTSSSSTSISSCSDLESDCADLSTSLCSSHDPDELTTSISCQDFLQAPESHPPAREAPSLALHHSPTSPASPCSPDEGYPSAPASPSSDYLGVKGQGKHLGAEVNKLGLLDFLESVGEFGKMERFSQVIQIARLDLDGEQPWDVLRDRLDHLDHLEKVNREVKLAYIARLHDQGLDLGDLEEQDLSDVLDEMGNIDLSWKLYKGRGGTLGDSQEFSDAGVDLTAPSDCDEPLAPDSLTPSPVEPPPRPPKPPVRHASVTSDLHTYINISRETTSIAVSTCPTPTLSTFSPNSSSPTFSTFRCEKPLPPSPPSVPPLPVSQAVPYFTLYTAPLPPTLPTPAPPIPPPRKRHLARKEAQRLAALRTEREASPVSLPPPTTRPPPLPPPPVTSISSSSSTSPPAIPPPPPLPPPPSFHALDVEIRKLLMLAGLTQAELLKLSPELGVCVGGLEEEGDGGSLIPSGPAEPQETRHKGSREEERKDDFKGMDREGWSSGARLEDRKPGVVSEGKGDKERGEMKDTLRTTSFTELARRRKRNTGPASDHYYTTGLSSRNAAKANSISFETFNYSPVFSESPPPPPPPRPLPPIPPSVPALKACTLSANFARPERFDWLIAFTPEGDAPRHHPPPGEVQRSGGETPTQQQSSSSSTGSSLGSAPKVTTFKELRFRSKNNSPPTKVINDSEPDPTVITPDPDILYNLKWRREKKDSDGVQWEYTSQARAIFMQPPPALTSMAALQEMLQRADEEGRRPELCASPKTGCSVSDGNLWTVGEEWKDEEVKRDTQEQEEEEVEVRGRADGERTLDSRTTVSSPPLSLTHSHSHPSPYFLHAALPRYRPGYRNSHPTGDARPRSHVGKVSTEHHCIALSPQAPAARADSPVAGTLGDESQSAYESPTQAAARSTRSACRYTRQDLDCDVASDSLYRGGWEERVTTHAPVSHSAQGAGCSTPYKNIDAMLSYASSLSATDPVYAGGLAKQRQPGADQGSGNARASKELPPLPTCYLYHPKSCPMHRGAPPRLSPIGALSPPRRSGAPAPGVDGCRLSSPLFPRSHTLPALAAPLYYPYLYPAIPPRAPPLPPKLHQAPARPRVPTQWPVCRDKCMACSKPSSEMCVMGSQSRRRLYRLRWKAVRSVSFAGSVQRSDISLMGEDLKIPVRGLGLSALCLQEKKALVSAVSVAVEAILAQFSSSRSAVQKPVSVNKALSGNSSVNPSLGRLVLQCLCPSLHSLLSDGLKSHQSDLIAGRRPNSAWGLVQASTKPGSKTQALYSLQVKVGALPQLKQSKHRFNAFLLGLLNTKQLDLWISHLQSCSDVLETYYHPTSFMRLSFNTCLSLFEELLLLLQPLSLLTFKLDLLFQHHHLEPATHSPEIPSTPSQDPRFRLSPRGSLSKVQGSSYIESLSELNFGSPECVAANTKTSSLPKASQMDGASKESSNNNLAKPPVTLGQTSPQLLWVQEKEIGDLSPPCVEEVSLTQQAGQVIQEGLGAVVRWGGRLSQNIAELSLSGGARDHPEPHAQAGSDFPQVDSAAAVPWGLGRLFGASKGPTSPPGHIPQTRWCARRPSQWLVPGVTALTRMVSSSSIPMLKREPEAQQKNESQSGAAEEVEPVKDEDKPRPLRSVRTLCDHHGTGSELSFCKGEELVVLAGVDQDWIRCRQGDQEGLVPIGYTSLIM